MVGRSSEEEVQMKATLSYVALAALTLSAGAVAAQQSSPAPGADATTTDAASYVMKAGASDLFEIQSSQLAQQKASSPAVRDFGKMMIDHHSMTTRQIGRAHV